MERVMKNIINIKYRNCLLVIFLLVFVSLALEAQVKVRQDSIISVQSVNDNNSATLITNDVNGGTTLDTVPQASLINTTGTYVLKPNLTGIPVTYLAEAQKMVDSINIVAKLVKANFPAINAYDYGTYLFQQLYTYEGGLEAFILSEFTKDHGNSDQYIILYRILDPNSGYQQTKVIMKLPQTISPCLQIDKLNGDINAYSSRLYNLYQDRIGSIHVELLRYIMFKVGKLGCCVLYQEENRNNLGLRSNPLQCDAIDPLDNLDAIEKSRLIMASLFCNNQSSIELTKNVKISTKNLPIYPKDKQIFVLHPFPFLVFKKNTSSNIDSISIGEFKFSSLSEQGVLKDYTYVIPPELVKPGDRSQFTSDMYIYHLSNDFIILSLYKLNYSTGIDQFSDIINKTFFESLRYRDFEKNPMTDDELISFRINYSGCFWQELCQNRTLAYKVAFQYLGKKDGDYLNYQAFGKLLLNACGDLAKESKEFFSFIKAHPITFMNVYNSANDSILSQIISLISEENIASGGKIEIVHDEILIPNSLIVDFRIDDEKQKIFVTYRNWKFDNSVNTPFGLSGTLNIEEQNFELGFWDLISVNGIKDYDLFLSSFEYKSDAFPAIMLKELKSDRIKRQAKITVEVILAFTGAGLSIRSAGTLSQVGLKAWALQNSINALELAGAAASGIDAAIEFTSNCNSPSCKNLKNIVGNIALMGLVSIAADGTLALIKDRINQSVKNIENATDVNQKLALKHAYDIVGLDIDLIPKLKTIGMNDLAKFLETNPGNYVDSKTFWNQIRSLLENNVANDKTILGYFNNLIKTDIITHAKLAEKGISPKGYYYLQKSKPGFILCN